MTPSRLPCRQWTEARRGRLTINPNPMGPAMNPCTHRSSKAQPLTDGKQQPDLWVLSHARRDEVFQSSGARVAPLQAVKARGRCGCGCFYALLLVVCAPPSRGAMEHLQACTASTKTREPSDSRWLACLPSSRCAMGRGTSAGAQRWKRDV